MENAAEVRSLVRKAVNTALKGFAFDAGYIVSVSFVDKEEIRKLNANFRNVDAVTDVLSFPMEEKDPKGLELLGDIVICVKKASEQAEELGHSTQREIAYLSVHSALHLMGYDHMEEADRLEMRAEEKRIMKILQIFKNESEYEA